MRETVLLEGDFCNAVKKIVGEIYYRWFSDLGYSWGNHIRIDLVSFNLLYNLSPLVK